MTSLEDFRRSIRTARDLGAVVKTMKTMAAVNIRQYEGALEAVEGYARTIRRGLGAVRDRGTGSRSPGGSDRLGVVAFGSDQGMCGTFNEQVLMDVMSVKESDSVARVVAIGARLIGELDHRGVPLDATGELPGSLAGLGTRVQDVLVAIESWRQGQDLGRVVLLHHVRSGPMSSAVARTPLLPIPVDPVTGTPTSRRRPIPWLSPPPRQLLAPLVHQFLFITLYRAFIESMAAENAARIRAMQTAQKNIEERVADLVTDYNGLRQTSITSELLDVITGFEALREDPAP